LRRFNRGGCENDLYIRRDDLEDVLVRKLQSELLTLEAVDFAIAEYRQRFDSASTSSEPLCNRGGCENDLYIRRDDLEDVLVRKLQSELLTLAS
jgi:hypothetical protein